MRAWWTQVERCQRPLGVVAGSCCAPRRQSAPGAGAVRRRSGRGHAENGVGRSSVLGGPRRAEDAPQAGRAERPYAEYFRSVNSRTDPLAAGRGPMPRWACSPPPSSVPDSFLRPRPRPGGQRAVDRHHPLPAACPNSPWSGGTSSACRSSAPRCSSRRFRAAVRGDNRSRPERSAFGDGADHPNRMAVTRAAGVDGGGGVVRCPTADDRAASRPRRECG